MRGAGKNWRRDGLLPTRTAAPPAEKCPGCGGTFIDNGIRCCVAHAPGTCCHYGETPTDASGSAIELPGKAWIAGRWENVVTKP